MNTLLFEVTAIPEQASHSILLLSKIMPVDEEVLAPD